MRLNCALLENSNYFNNNLFYFIFIPKATSNVHWYKLLYPRLYTMKKICKSSPRCCFTISKRIYFNFPEEHNVPHVCFSTTRWRYFTNPAFFSAEKKHLYFIIQSIFLHTPSVLRIRNDVIVYGGSGNPTWHGQCITKAKLYQLIVLSLTNDPVINKPAVLLLPVCSAQPSVSIHSIQQWVSFS